MSPMTEQPAEDIKVLQRCISDLVSVLALPAIWQGRDAGRVARTLAEALMDMLRLDVTYLKVEAAAGGEPIETVCFARPCSLAAREVGGLLRESLAQQGDSAATRIASPVADGTISVLTMPLGVHGWLGQLIVGCRRKDFPLQTESLVLSVAANQAVIGFQEAVRLSEHQKLTSQLDQRVALRTAELAAANQELDREAAERGRAEKNLRTVEANFRQIVNSLPGLVCTLSPTGELQLCNQLVLEFFGKSVDELRGWKNNGMVHPDDLPDVIAARSHALSTGIPYHHEHRCRRADGVYRWLQVDGLPVRDADATITGWYVLLTDIDDRKRSEDAIRASESSLTQTINAIPALAWSARPDGSGEFFSQSYLDYVGLSAEEVEGWGWSGVVHPDDLEALTQTWLAQIAAGEAGETEARLRRYDGEYRWFLFRANPLRDKNGKVVKWYGTNTDIQHRKQTEDELRASEIRLLKIINTLPTTAWSTRPDGHVDFLSDRWLDYAGFTAQQAEGWGWGAVIYPDDSDALVSYWQGCLNTGTPVDTEARMRRFDGTYRRFLFRANPLRDDNGTIVKWYGANIDIEDRKQAEEALGRLQSELSHISRVSSLGVLTASIAHEVNQPLAGIITNASTCLRMLASSPPNIVGASETAQRMIRDGNRAADVIARLRAMIAKRDTTALEPVDLNEAAREVVALSRNELQRNGVILQWELSEDLPLVAGDRVQLQQVILNLLLNALDALANVYERAREITIRTHREDGEQILLAVRDTGVGIDTARAEAVFDSFYTTKTNGMGIGLSVSRAIIDGHHGRLWCSQNEGPGTTFLFTLPCASKAPHGVLLPPEASSQRESGID